MDQFKDDEQLRCEGKLRYNGKIYGRVSGVIRPFSDFSRIDPNVLANKARIGTEVHAAIADDINGDFGVVGADGKGYFDSYLKWKEALNPVFSQSEMRYFCDDKMLTGQIDCLAYLSSGINLPALIDFKTSAQESKETWEMQAHLYNYLLAKNGITVALTYRFVKLDKNGALPKVFCYLWNDKINSKCMKAIDNFWINGKK